MGIAYAYNYQCCTVKGVSLAMAESVVENGEVSGIYTEEDINQKHRKERKELQSKIQSLKKSSTKGDKKKKKEIAEEIARLEAELDQKQNEELAQFKETGGKEINETTENLKNIELSDEKQPKQHRLTKAQKRREKKAVKEKEREHRIAEQEKENEFGVRNVESVKLKALLKERNLMVYEIPSDGNCLYNAVIHQLESHGERISLSELRGKIGDYLRGHRVDFLPFLTSPDTGDPLTEEQYEDYCNQVANTTAWGGQIELQALSHVLGRPIEVLQADSPKLVLGEEYDTGKSLLLTYHRHEYGLGEHYNSIQPYVESEEDTNDAEGS